MNQPAGPCDLLVTVVQKGDAMQLSSFQVSQLKALLTGERPLAQFCDSIEGEFLCRSGLVRILPPKVGIRSIVALSERGRNELDRLAA